MNHVDLAALLKRPHKYRAQPIEVGGVKFASKAEANRWFALQTLQQNGVISDLKRQVTFDLSWAGPHGVFKRAYVADFTYTEGGERVVEDCKGFITDTYRIKRDLMRAIHGITIRETGKGRGR